MHLEYMHLFRDLLGTSKSFRRLQDAASDDIEKLIQSCNFSKMIKRSCKTYSPTNPINHFSKRQLLMSKKSPKGPERALEKP